MESEDVRVNGRDKSERMERLCARLCSAVRGLGFVSEPFSSFLFLSVFSLFSLLLSSFLLTCPQPPSSSAR